MIGLQQDQRIVLSVLAFLSACESERHFALQEKLDIPCAVLDPSLARLQAADYICVASTPLERAGEGHLYKITDTGRAYFLEKVGQLKMLIDLLGAEGA